MRGCSTSASGLFAAASIDLIWPRETAGLERTRSSRDGAFAAAARQSQVVRSGNLDRDDPRACLRGDGGVSAEDGERSPDCRIARRSNLGRGAAAVSQIVNGALPRVSTALLKVILVLPRPPPGEGQDSCPAFGRFHGSAMPKHTRGADGASRSTCGCPAPDYLVVVRRVAVNRSGQREDTLQRHVHMLWMTDGQD